MSIKILLFLSCYSLISICYSQTNGVHTFGEPLSQEFTMTGYALDPEATGVVLYERGNYTVDAADGYIRLFKEVHRKIKVFDAKHF